jgi:L-2-hydroxyglutarate oxidase LhgO
MSGVEADVAVIGAGVVGLAVARALARAGRAVYVIERERFVGFHTSSRNSEVIHSGIYYSPGSWKARLCVQGREALYAYCAERRVPHARPGKLVIATSEEEVPALQRIAATARANGVLDLRQLPAEEVHRLEPEVRAVLGLFSPSTGIVDSHALISALAEDAREAGAELVLATPVLSGRTRNGSIELRLGGEEPASIRFRLVVNSAGPWAPELARRIEGAPRGRIPEARFAKGHYFVLAGASPFRHLVYPVPVTGGLGTHLTLDLAGRARFGPDVAWVDGVDYRFDETREGEFYRAVRRYWPGLRDGQLQPGYTGIRPKISGPGAPAADFSIEGPEEHGIPGLVHLFGIESPGLTACLALADEVVRRGTG